MSGSGDLVPRASQLDFVLIEVDSDVGEEGAVELTSGFVVGDAVDGSASVHEVGGLLEGGRYLCAGGFVAGLFGAGGELFAGDAVLFAAQQVERDGFGVGEFE